MNIAVPTNNVADNTETPKRSQNAAYCKYLKAAGLNPILIPMEADTKDVAKICDGLLLAGGIDIDPIYYGVSNSMSMSVDPEKDAHERHLFHSFRMLKKPVFGICRGFQLIARELLFYNKDVNRYIFYMENIERHTQTGGLNVPRRFPSHMVKSNTGSLYSGKDDKDFTIHPVNSMHHQAVCFMFNKLAKDAIQEEYKKKDFDKGEPSVSRFKIGKLDIDIVSWTMRGVKYPSNVSKEAQWAIVEGIKIGNWGSSIMGVQWHPEEMMDVSLVRNFFENNKTKPKNDEKVKQNENVAGNG
jgi:gamma-glutamyl-gamma-aminobutyrate hydrolase PuuD